MSAFIRFVWHPVRGWPGISGRGTGEPCTDQRITRCKLFFRFSHLPHECFLSKDKVFFRTFDDKKRSNDGRKKDVELWNNDSIISVLKTENAQDRGVFYVVNGGGQKIKNVQKARAQFIDFDDFSFEEQIEKLNQFQFEPT